MGCGYLKVSCSQASDICYAARRLPALRLRRTKPLAFPGLCCYFLLSTVPWVKKALVMVVRAGLGPTTTKILIRGTVIIHRGILDPRVASESSRHPFLVDCLGNLQQPAQAFCGALWKGCQRDAPAVRTCFSFFHLHLNVLPDAFRSLSAVRRAKGNDDDSEIEQAGCLAPSCLARCRCEDSSHGLKVEGSVCRQLGSN